jgi:Flp pilus assembly protein TadG
MTQRKRLPFKRIWSDKQAMSLVEFALSFPILITMVAGGTELANYATVTMRVSQLALQVADNASRIGVGDPIAALEVRESDINDILTGARIQAANLNITSSFQEPQNSGGSVTKGKARVMIASLEVMNPLPVAPANPADKYYIRWQRCTGAINNLAMTGVATEASQYGTAGRPSGTNMPGMGPAGRRVTVPDGFKIMFVEVRYRYEPLFFNGYKVLSYNDINAVSSMIVRDDRQDANPTANAVPSTCT